MKRLKKVLATCEQSFIRLTRPVPGPFAYFSVMKSKRQKDLKLNKRQQLKVEKNGRILEPMYNGRAAPYPYGCKIEEIDEFSPPSET